MILEKKEASEILKYHVFSLSKVLGAGGRERGRRKKERKTHMYK